MKPVSHRTSSGAAGTSAETGHAPPPKVNAPAEALPEQPADPPLDQEAQQARANFIERGGGAALDAVRPPSGQVSARLAQAGRNSSRALELVERFPSLDQWQRDLETGDRALLQQALFGIAQAFAYSDPRLQQQLLALVLAHPAQQQPELAATWVEGLFRIGGDSVEAALRVHAEGSAGSDESRTLARSRAQEMQDERATRAVLARAPAAQIERGELLRLPLARDFGDGVDDVADLTLTPERLGAQLEELGLPAQRQRLLAAGVAPVVATDCDGTTWKHDIGEALFARAVEQRLFLPAAHDKLCRLLQRYGLDPTDDINDGARRLMESFDSGDLYARGEARGLSRAQVCAEYYAANLWCFAGHSVASMKSWGRELFEGDSGFRGKVFDGLAELMQRARQGGLIPYAVSASNQWIVEVGAEYLGIPPWRVAGIRARVEDGLITCDIEEPITYGAGKVDAVQRLCGGAAAVAMGDSVDATDREMLESALIKLAVEPKSSRLAFVVARGQDNWRLLDYQQTEDGEVADTLSPA